MFYQFFCFVLNIVGLFESRTKQQVHISFGVCLLNLFQLTGSPLLPFFLLFFFPIELHHFFLQNFPQSELFSVNWSRLDQIQIQFFCNEDSLQAACVLTIASCQEVHKVQCVSFCDVKIGGCEITNPVGLGIDSSIFKFL